MDIGEFDYFDRGSVRKKSYGSYFYQRSCNIRNSLHGRLEKQRWGVGVTREWELLKAVTATRAVGGKGKDCTLAWRSKDQGIATSETRGNHSWKPISLFPPPPCDLLSMPPFSEPSRKPAAKGTKRTSGTSSPDITCCPECVSGRLRDSSNNSSAYHLPSNIIIDKVGPVLCYWFFY